MGTKLRFRYKGEFPYDAFYNTIISFYKKNRYTYKETKSKQKSNEAEFKFTGERKATDYFKFQVDVHYLIFNAKFPEKGMASGDMDIRISNKIIKDYQKIYNGKKGFFWDIIIKMMNFLMTKEEEEVHEDYVDDEIFELEAKIKKLLRFHA